MKILFTVLTLLKLAFARFGSHEFPTTGHFGEQLANEYQMILPEHIKIAKAGSLSDVYAIKEISPLVISSGDTITIKYSSTAPYKTDWIGAYSPADVDITTTVPIKYGWCDDSSTYISTGSGELVFNLTNVREDVVFYYFIGSTGKNAVSVAKSTDVVSFKNINEPLRPRVVPTGNLDIFNLLWSSATSKTPTLRWGLESGVYTSIVPASTSRVDKSQVCGSPANTTGWRDLGLIHTASFEGMKSLANKKIFYTFGDADTGVFSTEHSLFVPPLPGTQPPTRPTTVILYDDMGRGSNDMSYTWNEYGRASIETVKALGAEVASGGIDAIYHGGDISYATGYMVVWDFYLDMLAPVASSVIYLTTVGNHESDWTNSASYFSNTDSGGECGVLATNLIPMPTPATLNEPWWSYNVGLMHMIGISTEHDFTIGSKQYEWLVADLKAVDRAFTPWVIFGAHRAMYLNSNYAGKDTADIEVMDLMIANLEPLLFKYKVNLGFYGHNHVVQRQSAVLNKKVVQASELRTDENGNDLHWQEDPQATVHLVIGTAGADFTMTAMNPKPDWNEDYYYRWGYSRAVAHNSTYLYWEWIESNTTTVYDRMVITQKDPFAPFASLAQSV